MSHKEAKRQRKEGPPSGQDFQIVITMTQEEGVRCTFPTNTALTLFMMGEAVKIIGQHSQFVPPSSIVKPPPNLRI